MPSPGKKPKHGGGGALARLFSGLRPPDRGGSLVVQTGFPTSLADLVVKNRGRLKKPSRGRKKRSPSPQSPYPDPAVSRPHAVIGREADATRSLPPGKQAAVSAPESSITYDSGISKVEIAPVAPISSERREKGSAFGLGHKFLMAANLVILVLLAIRGKNLVVQMTLSAVALLLLDSVKLGVFQWVKPCPEARHHLNSAVSGLDLGDRGLVSPIREAAIEARSFSTRSGISLHSMCSNKSFKELMGSDQEPELLLATTKLASVGRGVVSPIREATVEPRLYSTRSEISVHSMCSDKCFKEPLGYVQVLEVPLEGKKVAEVDSRSSKSRQLFKKFFPKIIHVKRKSKVGNAVSLDSSGRGALDSRQDQEANGGGGEDGEAGDGEQSFSSTLDTAEPISEEQNSGLRIEISHGSVTKAGDYLMLPFCAVVLLGLIGGKAAALIVTLSCYLSISIMKSLWVNRSIQGNDLVPCCSG